MTLFFICAALLALLSVGWLLFGLFRADGLSADQEAVNITLARERRETLEVALADGAIDQSTYNYERQQLEYDLAADLTVESQTTTRKGGHIAAAVFVSAFIPITAGALYLHLGNPAAITQSLDTATTQANSSADNLPEGANLADMLPKMEERLSQQPDDIEGWRLLGRSYLSVGEFGGARRAFGKALALDENDVPTMTQLAESIAMTQEGDLSGEPLVHVKKANTLDPDNEHALWLLSIAQQQLGDHATALQGFDRLIEMSGDNAQALTTINQMRVRSVEALSGSGSSSIDSTNSTESSTVKQPVLDTVINVIVNVSDDARSSVKEDQVVFVYARATQGPPMPLAVATLTVADLPASVTLDDSMAMIPNMTLSKFPSVTVGARISTTGDAIAQSGDWFSEAPDLDTSTVNNVELVIDTQKP